MFLSTMTPPGDGDNKPATRGRVFLYALAPIALLALLSGGMRLATDADAKQQAESDAQEWATRQRQRQVSASGKHRAPKPR